MNLETISNKIDNLDYTLKEIVEAINQTKNVTITNVIIALTAIAAAIIISQMFFVKYLKKMQKQITDQNKEIEKLKEEGRQK